MTGTITRITIGPSQNHTPQPVTACRPIARKASEGTTRPISQRYRLRSVHVSDEPGGTVPVEAVMAASSLSFTGAYEMCTEMHKSGGFVKQVRTVAQPRAREAGGAANAPFTASSPPKAGRQAPARPRSGQPP